MNTPSSRAILLATTSLLATAAAQAPDMLVTYSQPEATVSGSGGTVMQKLLPNEIAHLEWSNGPCAWPSAEKWAPRTSFDTMAGDEDGDGTFFEPTLFGRIDALCVPFVMAPGNATTNGRNVFWSPEQTMGTVISGAPSLRPGDVGRIVRIGLADGQVEYFMRQEEFNTALGLPLNFPLDVDAVCFQPGLGVYFSVDQDVPGMTFCGPTFFRDGDLLCVPDWAITWTPDFRVAAVLPNSAAVVYSEAVIDLMVANAGVADHLGNCVNTSFDLESLDFDWNGTVGVQFPCPGAMVQAPDFVFSVETTTGAALLTTIGFGSIYNHLCGPAATPCPGQTWGPQMGVQATSSTVGATSYVNALAFARTYTHVLEPKQATMFVPGGAPAGANAIDYNTPWPVNFVFVELVSPTVPASQPAWPFSQLCFPDTYIPNLILWTVVPNQFGSIPLFPIPPALPPTKLLIQSVGIGGSGFELSTPAVVDIN